MSHAGGNLRLIAAMTEGVPVIYNSRVKKIVYAADGVAVQTDTHVFKGDFLRLPRCINPFFLLCLERKSPGH